MLPMAYNGYRGGGGSGHQQSHKVGNKVGRGGRGSGETGKLCINTRSENYQSGAHPD